MAAGNKPTEDIRADDEHVIWPFVGEYWRDELGYYRVKIRNKCQRNAPEGAPATGEGAAPAAPRRGWRCTSRGWRRSDAVEPIRLEIRKGQMEKSMSIQFRFSKGIFAAAFSLLLTAPAVVLGGRRQGGEARQQR